MHPTTAPEVLRRNTTCVDESNHPEPTFDAAVTLAREYARQRPEVVAMWAFGIGFILGWKLKPW